MTASLWLCPPARSPIEAALQKLITETIPPHFGEEKVPAFRPHMTITSDIPDNLDPEEVLKRISVSGLVEVSFKELNIGKTYYTRGTLHLERTPVIVDLARQCRGLFANGGTEEEAVDKWEKEVFTPHVSLVYSAMDPVPDNIRKAIEQDLQEANIGVLHWNGPKGEMRGWKGGSIVLVSTHKPIEEWETMAERAL
ncbi:2, 3 cyclic phosphodiesterase [Choiromyces venosus 120613-1]|uniref:2, 3 cyclic phosphodiesterase n=1 Tax=Choiromyces venosus 120613-1 TaxID=1336337 RepID=A0A3N4IVV7_9PEZI|nr:2, 3 cyclic phosphodiesterase [Choiromyces venosus 120613-1]